MGILVLYRTDAMVYAVGFMQRHLSDLNPKDYCQGKNFSQTTKPRVAHPPGCLRVPAICVRKYLSVRPHLVRALPSAQEAELCLGLPPPPVHYPVRKP